MKKFTAMLITAVMLVSALLPTAAFASFSDVEDTNPYKKAITTLSLLSVIDGYEENGATLFKPENTITRAEFTKLIVFMLGYQNITYSSYDFTDVTSDHWARNYIQTAYNLKIIAGYGDGIFAPDAPVKYQEALKMIVCTLGYEAFAQQLGSWPDGYIQEATSLGLTKGISGTAYTDGAPRSVIAQALYNALEIDMYENNDGIETKQTTKTLLNDYIKAKKIKGTLVGVEDEVTEDCSYTLAEDHMDVKTSSGEEYLIDYSEYTSNKSELMKYLGNTITVYYRQLSENDEMTLIIIDDETTKNSQIEITHDELSSLSGTTFKYYETASKLKTLKLRENDMTVQYNGENVPADRYVNLTNPVTKQEESFSRKEALEQWLNPDTDYTIYGTVRLVDSGDDGSIDLIQIYDYDVIVAYSAPSTADYRITDKLVSGNYIILDPQSADYTYTITRNGASAEITSIAANDVILYAKSLSGSKYTLNVSNKTVNGTVSSMNTSNSQMTISGTTYDVKDSCFSYILDKDGRELKTGVSGTFYLDAFGSAVFGTLDKTTAAPYSYIVNAYLDYDEGGKAYVTVYAPNVSASEAKSYQLKDRVKFNGSNTDSEIVIDKLAETAVYAGDESEIAEKIYGAGKAPTVTEYSQPARVNVQDNVVTEIITLSTDELQTQNDSTDKLAKCKELEQYTYSSNGFTLNGKTAFSVNSNTVVIYVPANRTEKKKYAKKTVSSAFTSGESYYLEAYDINSSKIAGLIILYGNDGTLTTVRKDTDYSVVASEIDSAYSDVRDDTVLQFDVFTGSSAVKSWMTYDSKEFSNVQVGDVIQFAYDSDNLMQGRVNVISFSDVAAILDGREYDGQLYNWSEEQTPTEDNNYQKYVFDYRFKRTGTEDDEMYTSSTLGTIPYSRATVYNVSQVLTDEKKIYVTQNGFSDDGSGVMQLDDSDYEELSISSAKILRMEKERDEISPYVEDTTTNLSINDLKDAKNYGTDCSKILVCSMKGTVRLILIYN